MNFKLFYIVLLLLLFSQSCQLKDENKLFSENIKQPTPPNEYLVEFNPLTDEYKRQKRNEIEQFFNSKINFENKFSGGFLVAKNGQIIYETYQGFANYEKQQPITAETPLHLASVSKVLTAAVVLRMIDEGKLTLNQTVTSVLDDFKFTNITLQDLLNHRSGLPNYLYFTSDETLWDKQKMLTNTDVFNLLKNPKITLEFQPDQKFSYCNTNYVILALIIEKISNLSYPEAMKILLFEPLGMKNTFVFDYFTQKDNVSESYKSTYQPTPYDPTDAVYGDKNIYSTPQDLLKFDRATYSDTFMSKTLKNLIYKGYSYEKFGIKNYGLGIRLREWEDGQKIFYHNGWWHGNTTSYINDRNDTVTLIALSNRYTKRVYQTIRLTALFGNYPFTLQDEEE